MVLTATGQYMKRINETYKRLDGAETEIIIQFSIRFVAMDGECFCEFGNDLFLGISVSVNFDCIGSGKVDDTKNLHTSISNFSSYIQALNSLSMYSMI